MSEPAQLYTIGQAAQRVGVPARTIRFWCDAGILAPTDRSPEARPVLDRVIPPATAPAERDRIRGVLETFTDERVERYWELAGILNGRPPFPRTVPAFQWVIAALRAQP